MVHIAALQHGRGAVREMEMSIITPMGIESFRPSPPAEQEPEQEPERKLPAWLTKATEAKYEGGFRHLSFGRAIDGYDHAVEAGGTYVGLYPPEDLEGKLSYIEPGQTARLKVDLGPLQKGQAVIVESIHLDRWVLKPGERSQGKKEQPDVILVKAGPDAEPMGHVRPSDLDFGT